MKSQKRTSKINTLNIIGKGLSIKDFDMQDLYGDVMAINDAIHIVPDAMYCVFWDEKTQNKEYLHDIAKKVNKDVITISINENKADLQYVNYGSSNKWADVRSLDCNIIPNVNLTGLMALAVAIRLQYRKIYLFGIDGKRWGDVDHYDGTKTKWDTDKWTKYNKYYVEYIRDADITNVINPEYPSVVEGVKRITYEQYREIANKKRAINNVIADDVREGTATSRKEIHKKTNKK